jgi:hypothetical protein
MNIDQITILFGWMTLINVGIMILSAILIVSLKPFIGKFHGRLFGLSEETLNPILYGYLGIYKVLIIVFNLVPYLALQLIK